MTVSPGREGLEGPEGLEGQTSCLSRLSCLSCPLLYFRRLTDHLLQRPPLPTAHRPRLNDRDGIADLRFALLVVDHELRRPSLRLAVQAVPHLPLHGDDDALLHLVADDGADFL